MVSKVLGEFLRSHQILLDTLIVSARDRAQGVLILSLEDSRAHFSLDKANRIVAIFFFRTVILESSSTPENQS